MCCNSLNNYQVKGFNILYVNIKLAGEVICEQKAQAAKEMTETLARITHQSKSCTDIAFEEVAYEDRAIAGQLLDE